MNWDVFTPWASLCGGALIGLATGLVLVLNGKIAGISGVAARILRPAPGDVAWRVWFVIGLITSGAVAFAAFPQAIPLHYPVNLWGVGAAGLLVGLGTRVGGGCTSGHGVCGISRGSKQGVVGTCVFMAVAVLTVWVRRQLAGAGS